MSPLNLQVSHKEHFYNVHDGIHVCMFDIVHVCMYESNRNGVAVYMRGNDGDYGLDHILLI